MESCCSDHVLHVDERFVFGQRAHLSAPSILKERFTGLLYQLDA
jgi:hypothetical protein